MTNRIESDLILVKVQKLLRLAEDSGAFKGESRNAVEAAKRLMAKWDELQA